MSSDGDNAFDFLGGSLMKDLLADLAVDEDDAQEWLNLEQLERELHHLDLDSSSAERQPQSAAGLVVSAQQQAFAATAPHPSSALPPVPQQTADDLMMMESAEQLDALDAWSLSLQKFTASSSVAADFLQADSARKQQQQQQQSSAAAPPPPGLQPSLGPPPGLLDQAEEYDITATSTSTAATAPPPGIPPTSSSQQVISQAAAKLVQDLQIREEEIVVGKTAPPTTTTAATAPVPEESFVTKTPDEAVEPATATSATKNASLASPLLVEQLQKGLQAVQETEVLLEQEQEQQKAKGAGVAATPPTPMGQAVPPQPQQQQQPRVPKPLPVTPQNSMGYPPQPARFTGAPTPQPTPVASKTLNDASALNNVPPIPMMPPVVAVPLQPAAPVGPAWQTPPPRPPPRRVVFANPHPAAPPIHAAQLQSRYMKARDITYVVHGMLRPILAAESSGQMSTYHIQYWTRHHPVKPPASASKAKPTAKQDFVARELASRARKAQEWSESRKTLGSTAKANVARPRALIAVTNTLNSAAAAAASDGDSSSSKQRATLWKARIYCDQAYQALQAVTDSWKASGRAGAQPHLIKLFKCLGIHLQTVREELKDGGDDSGEPVIIKNQYSVDPAALLLLLKLPKGKVLLARVLEQALLPPPVVPVFMPVALELLCASAPSGAAPGATGGAAVGDVADAADDRVFLAWTAVLRTLPVIAGDALLETVRGIMRQAPSNNVLSTTARMQCVHALLQRGGDLAGSESRSSDDKNSEEAFAQDWAVAEQEFMALLA